MTDWFRAATTATAAALIMSLLTFFWSGPASAATSPLKPGQVRFVTDDFEMIAEASSFGGASTLFLPVSRSSTAPHQMLVEYVDTGTPAIARGPLKATSTTKSAQFDDAGSGSITVPPSTIPGVTVSLTAQFLVLQVDVQRAGIVCNPKQELATSVFSLLLPTPPRADDPTRGLSLCTAASAGAITKPASLEYSAGPVAGAIAGEGRERLSFRIQAVTLASVRWTRSAQATLGSATVLYWPGSVSAARTPVDVDPAQLTSSERDVLLARAVAKSLCIVVPPGWTDDEVASLWNEQDKETLQIVAGFASTKARYRPRWVKTSAQDNRRYCPSILMNESSVAPAAAGFIAAIVKDIQGAPAEVRLTVEFTPQDGAIGLTIMDGYLPLEPRYAAAALVDEGGNILSSFDVNAPIQQWARWVCVKPDGLVGADPQIQGGSLLVTDVAGNPLIAFPNKRIQLRTVFPNQLPEWRCAALSTEDAGANGASGTVSGNGYSSRAIVVVYDGRWLGDHIEPRSLSGYAGSNAIRLTHISLGTAVPVNGTASPGLPSAAFIVRAEVPLVGASWGSPGTIGVYGDFGFAPGIRFGSADNKVLTGVTVGPYTSLCLRLETKLTPRICGALSADVIVGERLTGAPGTTEYGLDRQVTAMVSIGAL